MQETVTLNTHEQKRVLVLNRILEGHLSTAEAAPLLKLSKRQVQSVISILENGSTHAPKQLENWLRQQEQVCDGRLRSSCDRYVIVMRDFLTSL